jgi:hypothetical protein
MELPDRLPVVHGVEGSHFVDAHWWHLKDACNLVHDRYGRVAVLALAEIEQGHHSGFLVLRGIALEDLTDEGFILSGVLEGDGGIVVGGVAVLGIGIRLCWSVRCMGTYDYERFAEVGGGGGEGSRLQQRAARDGRPSVSQDSWK